MKAPGDTGAFMAPAQKAAIAVISQQGGGEQIDASPTRIARMLQQCFKNELDIKAWEDMRTTAGGRGLTGKRYAMGPDGKPCWRPVSELVGDSLREARARRDEHIENLKQLIDYALTELAYETVPCPDCSLPTNHLEFVSMVAEFEPPDDCKSCSNSGVVRRKKLDEESKATFKRISYFSRVLDDVILCAKIRMGAPDRDEAFRELEEKNRNLLTKFGNEKQTSLEADDAEQGARMGLLDAARRFDPTRSEGATFNTVAYNWCRRNSRARHDWQKRPGIYAPSVEAMGTDEDGNGMSTLITDTVGGCGTFSPKAGVDRNLQLDMSEQIGKLPEELRLVIMAELRGDSVAKIARDSGMPAAKVRRLRKEAFEQLRDALAGYAVDMLRE